jgi:hypothetical protein
MEGSKLSGPWKESNDWRPMRNHLVWWIMEGSKLNGLWKESNVCKPTGKHFAEWLMEGSKLVGHWNVPCLDAFGKRRKRRSILFNSFHFLPHKILFKLFFH